MFTKTKKYLRQMSQILIKNQFLMKNNMAKIIHLNISLDIMTMMILGLYAQF